jgi:hypothetical protein
MAQEVRRMRTIWRWGIALGSLVVVAANAGAAIDPAFDFTGHWTGYGREDAKPQQGITADLTQQAGTRSFSGTVTIEDDPTFTCNVAGKQKPHKMKVTFRLTCDNGGRLNLHATLDAATQTVNGGYKRRGNHKVHTGTFTLAKQAS